MSAKLLKIIKIELNQDAEAAVALKSPSELGKLPTFYCLLAGVLSMSTRHWARSQFQFLFLFQANYGSHPIQPYRAKANCRAPFNKHSVNLLHLAGSHTAMSRATRRMAHCMPCLRFARPPSPPVASLLGWRSSLAPVVSAYCCAFIVMAMFFVVSFGGIVNAASALLLLLLFCFSFLFFGCL